MSGMLAGLVGFAAGILTMTVVSLYRWAFKIWNNGVP